MPIGDEMHSSCWHTGSCFCRAASFNTSFGVGGILVSLSAICFNSKPYFKLCFSIPMFFSKEVSWQMTPTFTLMALDFIQLLHCQMNLLPRLSLSVHIQMTSRDRKRSRKETASRRLWNGEYHRGMQTICGKINKWWERRKKRKHGKMRCWRCLNNSGVKHSLTLSQERGAVKCSPWTRCVFLLLLPVMMVSVVSSWLPAIEEPT